MRNNALIPIALFLVFIAGGVFFYKAFLLGFPLLPETRSTIWNIETRIKFRASGKSAQVSLYVPRSNANFAVMDENFISRGFGYTIQSSGPNRQATWSIRKAIGEHELFYRAAIRKLQTNVVSTGLKAPSIDLPNLEGAELAAAQTIIADINAESADIESFFGSLAKRISAVQLGDNLRLLLGKHPSDFRKVDTAVKLLLLAGYNARAVRGVKLEVENNDAPLYSWIELFEDGAWKPYSIFSDIENISETYFPWVRGPYDIADLANGSNLSISHVVRQSDASALDNAVFSSEREIPALLNFSPFSLPLNTQVVYRILLMIPLGALVVAFIRTVIGVQTFGTFMPVLVALAFRETHLIWGIVLFCLVVGLGLAVRFALERLKLLLVPRLSAVLTTVVILMLLLSVITHKLDIERGLSVALFPMIIITMTIERMSVLWDELGGGTAIKRGVGSLVCATIVYAIFSSSVIEHFVFVFPEMLLMVLSVSMLLGRYTGYRLTELSRFRSIVDD